MATEREQAEQLLKLHLLVDFLNCDYWLEYYTKLTWWSTRRQWRWRHPLYWEGTGRDEPPCFRWDGLPKRLQSANCLDFLHTQLRLLEKTESPWCRRLPRHILEHIEQHLTCSEIERLREVELVLKVSHFVRWANTLRFRLKPLYEAKAARLRAARDDKLPQAAR